MSLLYKLLVLVTNHFPISLVIGVLLGAAAVVMVMLPVKSDCYADRVELEATAATPTTHKRLYVSVMTARSLLQTRAVAINQTWGQYAPRLDFYIAEDALSNHTADLPLIGLPDVPDGYPPLKKFFRTLQYIADHFIDEYSWFMRADDDSYVRVPELLDFLSLLDPSELLYIGSPGMGRKEDLNKLGLYTHELYCLGGPGTVFSRALLKKLRPHLEKCLGEATTYHDDAEVGKCISRNIGIQCTCSLQMKELFYHDYSNGSLYSSDVFYKRDRHDALTFHPLKDPALLYRMHQLFTEKSIACNQAKIDQLNHDRHYIIQQIFN